MTIKELIAELQKIENQNQIIMVMDRDGYPTEAEGIDVTEFGVEIF